jgi:hemoglobin
MDNQLNQANQGSKDILSKDDLILLVNTFYDRVRRDDVIGHIFNTIIGDDWSVHLPIMYTFWNTVLFGAEGYKGQAVGKHVEIDRKIQLHPEHYERWITLWRDTVDQLFKGPNAETIKNKAQTMLQLIQFKVDASRSGKSLF